MIDIQKSRQVKLIKFEKISPGEYDLFFEDDWFVGGDKICNNSNTIGFKVEYAFGITTKGYRAYPIKLNKNINIGDMFLINRNYGLDRTD